MGVWKNDLVDIELNKGMIHRSFLSHTIGKGDDDADRFGVRVYRNGEPVDLSGVSCRGFFRDPQGNDILLNNGVVSGNTAYVVLPQSCYNYEGNFSLAIKLTGGDATGTVRIVDGVVNNTYCDNAVMPTDEIPSLLELLAALDDIIAAANAVNGTINGMRNLYNIVHGEWNKIPKGGWTIGKYRRYQDGELDDNADWAVTDLFSVGSEVVYTVAYTNEAIYCFFDSNGDFISGGAILPENVSQNMETAIESPQGAYYMALSVGKDLVDVVSVCEEKVQTQLTLNKDEGNLLRQASLNDDYVYWNAVNDLNRNGDYMAYKPFVLYAGNVYYYANLCGYYCWIQDTTAGTIKRLKSDSSEVNSNGRLYVEHDSYFFVTIRTDAPMGCAYVGRGDSYLGKYLRGLTGTQKSDLIIECGANRDFTRLRDAIEAGMKQRNSKVIVYPGTYDLTQEFAEEIAQQSGTFGRVGIRVGNGIHVIFLPGSLVTALFPVSSEWINEHFEPFGYVWATDTGFTLEGLHIKASNCRYCVHDDPYVKNGSYHNVYKNCVMEYTNDPVGSGGSGGYRLAIGGGLGRHGYIEIIGGKYTVNNVADPNNIVPISYHNCGSDYDSDPLSDAVSQIVIKDAYIAGKGRIRFGDYGATEQLTEVFVSGCTMGGTIMHEHETPDAHNNFTITEWNNIIRS